jgi:adenine/guanine phosphoribosyltransferase-like PRPP-binding protein
MAQILRNAYRCNSKGDRVLIHDDVFATLGTAKAVCELVERLGGVIVQVNFLMELSFLNGREKIKTHPIFCCFDLLVYSSCCYVISITNNCHLPFFSFG